MVVVSPHQDDETLGCGGTIALLRRRGVEVSVVFMMDGSRSHKPLIPGDELSAVRRQEATAAVVRLGIPADHVSFLDFPEGKLVRVVDAARESLGEALARRRPAEVFVPSAIDPHEDHLYTNLATRDALRLLGDPVVVNEYPVWCWYHWPVVPLPLGKGSVHPPMTPRRELPRVITNTRAMGGGDRVLREFPTVVDVRAALGAKRHALDAYESQMTRFRPDPRWTTLGDVGNGSFVSAFFTGQERFRRYRLSAPVRDRIVRT